MILSSCPFSLSTKTGRILWEITSKCNMRCKHCLYYSSDGNSTLERAADLSRDEIFSLIDQIRDSGDIQQIWLSGGEPLVRQDIFKIIERIKSSNISPSLSTNASLISSNIAKQLKACGVDYVHVSIDGVDAETHDSFRRYEGAYEKVIAAIDFLREADIIVGATCIVTNDNINSLYRLVRQSVSQRLSVLSFYLVEPLGRGGKIAEKVDIKLMKKLGESFKQFQTEFNDRIKLELFRTSVFSDDEYLKDCFGAHFLTITNDGRLGSCPWLMKSNPQLLSQPLKDIGFNAAKKLVQQKTKEHLKNRLSSLHKCASCRKNIDCLKGCPAVSGQDQYDPLCAIIRR